MRTGLRIGLIGFGSIAEYGHLPAWLSLPGIDVAAVADLSPERLTRAGSLLPRAILFDSPQDLIAEADIDCIDICTPPSTHADLILACCSRGLADVVCEKPLVLSEDDYVRIARARPAGTRIVSINNWVHSDLNRHVAGLLREGEIGSVDRIELHTGRPDCALGNSGWMPRWRTNQVYSGGGIILDHGWHQFYLLFNWMREQPRTVSARTRTVDSRHFPVEDEASIDLQFPSGQGRIELSWSSTSRTNSGMIHGVSGTIKAFDDRIVLQNARGTTELPFRGRLTESSYHPEWFEAVFRANVLDECGAEADRNFAEAGVLVGVIRAAYRSAQESGIPHCPVIPDGKVVAGEDGVVTNGYAGGGAEA